MNLGKGSQLSQRRILLLSVLQRLEEEKKTEERHEQTVDVHYSGKQVRSR